MRDFSSVLAAWEDARLGALQALLASETQHVSDAQRDALASRKALAERTREFKREPPETQRESIRGLLKAYQTEIDALTTRAKHAEAVLANTSGRIGQMPDPYPVFEALVERTANAQDCVQLRAALETSDANCATLQKRIMDAEMRISELAQRDAESAAETARKVEEARAEADQRWEEHHASLQRELTAAQAHVRELRTNHEQFTAQSLTLGDTHTAQADTLVADLQRANERVAQAERRNTMQRAEAEQARIEASTMHREQLAALRERIADEEQAQTQLRASNEHLQAKASVAASDAQREVERQYAQALEDVASLRTQLAQRADYDEIKHELDVLRVVEFGDATDTTATEASLETHLVQKNRKLQDELATLRATLAEQGQRATQADMQFTAQRTRIEELEALSTRLETDLLGVSDKKPEAEPAQTISGILPIVTSQRDRFRTRNTELESELRGQLQTLAELRTEAKRLQTDNLGLYEKVRYLEGFGRRANGDMPYVTAQRDAGLEDLYRNQYEQSIHPFVAFRGREQSRAIASLGPVDRLLHIFTSAVLGHAQLRLVFVGYAVLLHLLVFGMLWDAGHRSSV
ncbi:hypothetical protein MVES1_003311 [Malassezia vespertilionis]|uniref:Protein CASP n=1 Tax=Malassezia vespertilionis TaxID=2020962 RepID=A0A2N1J6X1_9BASI|nr:uncharacterized protein MVES1_003311 [Malassezia vespertilionis]PKI82303.1 hypothetical protein MVES_003780 [Malassezia vespertilionis]WFD07942.1 hypothetical protein MVES1_003311 [Malassezia vespertilionis]